MPFWQKSRAACHFGRAPTVVGVAFCSALPPKRGDFLTAGLDRFILRPQSLDPFPTTRLTNLENHRVLTPTIAGIDLLDFSLAHIPQSLAVELENLFRPNRPDHTIGQTRLVWDCDAHETHTGGTLGFLDDSKLCHDFSPKDKGIIGTIDYKSTPIARGLPAVPPVFLAEHLIFLTLTPGDRLPIAHIVGVTSRIVTIVRTDLTMLAASRTNILKSNHRTTAIACHLSFSL